MRATIEFKECLKDSPKFRASLEDAESNIEQLETRLDRLVKLCSVMIESGKAFTSVTSGFISGIKDLASYFHDDSLVSACLNRFAQAMTEMQKYYTILMDQAHRSVCKNLNNFIRNDIKKVKETKKHFEKISDDMDGSLLRNSQAPRSKPAECEETNNVLTAMRSCFAHTSLDYVFQINVLNSKKRFDVLDTMLSFMHAQNAYFHQGNDLFGDLEPYMKSVAAQVEDLSAKAAIERKAMEERHTLVQQRPMYAGVRGGADDTEELSLNMTSDSSSSSLSSTSQEQMGKLTMDGYLFKKTSNAFKSWVRRWFTIQDNQLVYRKRSKDTVTVMEEDLRLCTVKPIIETERRSCFEVVSPSRSHVLQADSDHECSMWINAIQTGVSQAYRDSSHSQESEEDISEKDEVVGSPEAKGDKPVLTTKLSKSQLRMVRLFDIAGNSVCCDCGSVEPRWASINLGITLCIECSGIHRSLGVHLSKVRSVTLDVWDPELLKVMAELGNDVVNKIYEANVQTDGITRAAPDSKRQIRESWIKAKYSQKAFVSKLPGITDPRNSGEAKIRSWSVCRTKRKSPARTLTREKCTHESESEENTDLASGLLEAVLSVSSTKDNDSGIGGSSSDVLVFGKESLDTDVNPSVDLLVSSDESCEDDGNETDEIQSTTSWEDVSKLDPNTLLYKAAQARNLPVMLEALAHGANINWPNQEDDGKTALMKAIQTGSMAACEFLLLNGAKLDKKDVKGRTPLHHATIAGHTGQVCQFLKRGATQSALDVDGQDPLAIAVSNANADIVTLLRLAKLNEEMKETDGAYGCPGDETFHDVFKDFSNMASNHPEKLVRK